MKSITIYNNHIVRIAAAVVIILLIPFILTLLGRGVDGDGWHWTLGDFIVVGVLLFGSGLALDYTAKKIKNPAHRLIVCGIIALCLLYIWAELAVGVFTNLGS